LKIVIIAREETSIKFTFCYIPLFFTLTYSSWWAWWCILTSRCFE